MIDHESIHKAAQAHALTLSVCTTGAIALAASAAGGAGGRSAYVRTAGSFLTDKLAVGMQVIASGFTVAGNNGAAVITAVSALVCTVNRALVDDAQAIGRTLAVGLPSRRAWENEHFEPVVDEPHVEEQYIPGPTKRISMTPRGWTILRPMYQLQVHVPRNTGAAAARRYADALIAHYPSGAVITLDNGDLLRVRSGVGPYPGQLLQGPAGHAFLPVTFPFWMQTTTTAS